MEFETSFVKHDHYLQLQDDIEILMRASPGHSDLLTPVAENPHILLLGRDTGEEFCLIDMACLRTLFVTVTAPLPGFERSRVVVESAFKEFACPECDSVFQRHRDVQALHTCS